MVTIFQHADFLSGRALSNRKYLGSFFSRESAEQKLGFFFLANFCDVEKF